MILTRFYIIILFILTACNSQNLDSYDGTEIVKIPLAGEINNPNAEISGLDWFKDQLILMPEDPQSFSDNNCFRIGKSDIIKFLDNNISEPITMHSVRINVDFTDYINGIEGFEAIAFSNDTIFAVIEAKENSMMKAWLLRGVINKDMSQINFDPDKIVNIPAPGHLKNFSVETIFINNKNVCCVYEANGRNVNHTPVVYVFSKELDFISTIPFPNIEYRITDATKLINGHLWVTNTYYTGEQHELDIAAENLIPVTTGTPERHVERIIELLVYDDRVEIADNQPFMIKTIPEAVRNWEGLALFDDRGFLVVNDKFPKKGGTILAFIKRQIKSDN